MTLLFFSLVVIVALGFVSVRAMLGAPRSNRPAVVLQCVLGVGLGLGIASCSLFAIGVVADHLSRTALVGELFVFLGAVGLSWWLAGRTREWETDSAPSDSQAGFLWILVAGLAVAALVVLWGSIVVSQAFPDGQWDAWAIWNTRARFFVRAEENWTAAFLLERGHPDYPLLLPLTVARLWTCLGTETTLAPRIVSIAGVFGCAALLTSALAVLRGREQALLGGLVLLSTQAFVVHAASQMADLLLAFFFLAAFVSLCITDERGRTRTGALALAGAMAGMAAWTKNEGVLFALLIVVAHVGHTLVGTEWRKASPRIAALCAGLAPIAAVVLFFKLSYAPANDLAQGQGVGAIWERVTDAGRYGMVSQAFGRALVSAAGGFGVLLPLYVGMRRRWGVGTDWKLGTGTAIALTVLVGMIGGYFSVYILTPNNLAWHLRTSLARLLMQLWPCALFLIFLAATQRHPAGQETQGRVAFDPPVA